MPSQVEMLKEEVLHHFRELAAEAQSDMDQVSRELRELNTLVKQPAFEIDRLTARNNQIQNKLREMQLTIDNYSRADIVELYTRSTETEKQLFLMQSQQEQQQYKIAVLNRLQQFYERILELASQLPEETPEAEPHEELPADGAYVPGMTGMLRMRPGMTGSLAQSGGSQRTNPQQMMARVIQAQEDERLRLSRQIHDALTQSLSNLVLRADICIRMLQMDPQRTQTELSALKNLVNTSIQDTRRFTFDLRPMSLDDLGLSPTLRKYIQLFTEKTKVQVNLAVSGQENRLPNYAEVAIFRLVQEALNNASRHGHASNIQVSVDYEPQGIVIVVEDDGSGFDVQAVFNAIQERRNTGMGIVGMQERVDLLGGQLDIESQIGQGTRIVAQLPPIEGEGS